MDWLQFIAALVGSLAWPATIAFVVLLLRKPLGDLIPTLTSLRYKDLEMEFGEKLDQVEERVSKLPHPPRPPPTMAFDKKIDDRFQVAVEISPNLAVNEAWLPVEAALKEIANRHLQGFSRPPASSAHLVRILRDRKAIDPLIAAIIDDLRSLRNIAVHPDGDRQITVEQARRFKQLADEVVESLHL